MENENYVWVFQGEEARFPSAIFTRREEGEEWIKKNKVSGILSCYPVGVSVYEWAINSGYFEPHKPHELLPEYVQKFTCASQPHYHYVEGERD